MKTRSSFFNKDIIACDSFHEEPQQPHNERMEDNTSMSDINKVQYVRHNPSEPLRKQ